MFNCSYFDNGTSVMLSGDEITLVVDWKDGTITEWNLSTLLPQATYVKVMGVCPRKVVQDKQAKLRKLLKDADREQEHVRRMMREHESPDRRKR